LAKSGPASIRGAGGLHIPHLGEDGSWGPHPYRCPAGHCTYRSIRAVTGPRGRYAGSYMFRGRAWRIGRILGIDLRIHASWLFIAVAVSYFFFLQFRMAFGDLTAAATFALAVSAALLFFGSVLGHELGHALTARRRGIEVHGITLFLFGGATHARVESRGPIDELVVSVIGPLTSLGLAGTFWAARSLLADALPLEVALVLGFLGWLNLVLAIFNLLPGFPLDGGRVLRALVWGVTGNLGKATRVAGISGQVVGYLMIAGGVLMALTGRPVGGVWFAAIGWFLAGNARASYEEHRVQSLLGRVEAADVMSPPPPEAGSGSPPAGRREDPVVAARTPVTEVLARLRDRNVERVLVVEDRQVVGVITGAHLASWLAQRGLPAM
jgi:Zn-dependent protease